MSQDVAAGGNAVLTEKDGDVLVVTLNRPQSLNAINNDLLDGLKAAWDEAADPTVRGVVVTGAGRGFCAGADLRGQGGGGSAGGLHGSYNPHVLALAGLPKAVICAVNGPAAGAGLGLACAGDLRIAAQSAVFASGFVRIGVAPDAGASFYLPKLIGYSRAFEFLCGGERIDAARALEWGLVNEVVADDLLLERALQRAHQFAAMPGIAVEVTKRHLHRTFTATLPEMLDEEARWQPVAVAHPDRAAARERVASEITGSRTPS